MPHRAQPQVQESESAHIRAAVVNGYRDLLAWLCEEIDVAVDECDINRAAEARNAVSGCVGALSAERPCGKRRISVPATPRESGPTTYRTAAATFYPVYDPAGIWHLCVEWREPESVAKEWARG